MTITSIGYDGTVGEGAWAKLAPYLGMRYGGGGFAVSIGGTGDRAVTLSTGDSYGYGVLDTNSATINLNAASVSSGSRWDTVVVSRNWATNTTTAAIRNGTGTRAISGSLTHDPGVSVDDQPVALIRSTAGQTAVQELIDLRTFDMRLVFMADNTIDPDPTWFRYGEGLVKNSPTGSPVLDLFVRRGSTGTEDLVPLTGPRASGGLEYSPLSYLSGLEVFGGFTPWYTRAGGMLHLGGMLQRTGSTKLVANTIYLIATVSLVDRPHMDVTLPVATSFSGTAQGGRINVSASTGQITFTPAEDTSWFSLDGVAWLPKGS